MTQLFHSYLKTQRIPLLTIEIFAHPCLVLFDLLLQGDGTNVDIYQQMNG